MIRTGKDRGDPKYCTVATLTTNTPNGVARDQTPFSELSEQATNHLSDGTVLGE
jgi:hypothetical protein